MGFDGEGVEKKNLIVLYLSRGIFLERYFERANIQEWVLLYRVRSHIT